MKHIGILLTNTGTPDTPTAQGVRRYLREFLSDKRIVQLPRFLWLPILYGIILPFRSKKSARLYESIWQHHDSPLRSTMLAIGATLQKALTQETETTYTVVIGMNYGNPSIASALETLHRANIDELIVLPLFPQYSSTTTASSHDRLTDALKQQATLPPYHFIPDYAEHPAYIGALRNSLEHFWKTNNQSQHLLISFHGIPERFVTKGDPYPARCEKTAQALAHALQLPNDRWTLCYQSQFGYDKWLQPSTQTLLKTLPQRGIKTVDVICPGFSADCLETLEEIAIAGQKSFIDAGGEQLHYCHALNTQCDYLLSLVKDVCNT